MLGEQGAVLGKRAENAEAEGRHDAREERDGVMRERRPSAVLGEEGTVLVLIRVFGRPHEEHMLQKVRQPCHPRRHFTAGSCTPCCKRAPCLDSPPCACLQSCWARQQGLADGRDSTNCARPWGLGAQHTCARKRRG